MKSKLKRIFSAFLSAAVVMCTLPVAVVTTSAEETAPSLHYDAEDITDIQDGVILHCFDWKYTDIIAELPNIAAAGFNAVQTSPAQPAVNYSADQDTGIWWKLYQPLDFCIGTNWLGTKEELQQLCTEAHNYGIEVIVDIVSNHLASDHSNINANLKPSQYWHEAHTEQYWKDYSDKRYATTHKDLGMPDIASENSYVQQCVYNYIEELYSVGVDGLRWDTLKHIQLPVDINETNRCDFFTTVLNHPNYPNKYNYGEILGSPDGNNDKQNIQLMQEYTGLMSVTDDTYGKNLRDAFNEGKVPTTTGNWVNRGMTADTLVYWGESHDTWSNNKNYGYSNEMSQNVIDKAYAVAAARADTTSLYFSRPSQTVKDNILAGEKGSDHFKDAEVAAVNHFHNAFNGKSEYLSTWGDIVCTERGTKGAVLVSAKKTGTTDVAVPVYCMADGNYVDQVTNTPFTVENGIISGTIGETGIAVVYNTNDIEDEEVSTLYLKPSAYWQRNNARFAAYFFNPDIENYNEWVNMTSVNSGLYSVDIPSGEYTKVIFCRMNPATNENNWNKGVKWNQTKNMDIPKTNEKIYCVIAENTWENTVGSWDYNCSGHNYGQPIWNWGNYTSAVATFVCSECHHCDRAFASVNKNVDADYITYTATATFNGSNYSDSLPPIPRTKTTTLRLKPNSNWPKDSARFAVYLKTGNTEAWVSMTGPDSDGIYSAELPNHAYTDWENVIFCRMNGATTDNNWDNKWNQTSYLAIPENGDDLYTLNEDAWGDGSKTIGTWGRSAYVHTHSYVSPTWTWADDYSSATATFECSGCNKPFTAIDNAPVVGDISNIRTYTATVTGPDGQSYPSPVKYETMVVEEDQTGGVEYQLTHQEQLIKLYQCVINQESFTDGAAIDVSSCGIAQEDAAKAVHALIDLFPELNFIDKTKGWKNEYNGQYLSKVTFNDYIMTKAEFNTKLAAFQNKANEYLTMIDDNMDDFTKALVLHDRLVLDHYYQINTATEYSSNYTFMLDDWGRCENYAEVYAYLLARAGIKSELVSGDVYYPATETTPAKTGAHEWVKICLDGKWYNVDITFDDPIPDRPSEVSHQFFLIDDNLIKSDSYDNGIKHMNFTSYYSTDSAYNNYNTLHSNGKVFFNINGTLYTLYQKVNDNDYYDGVIAAYNPENDTYTDKYMITDRWFAGTETVNNVIYTYYYTGNYSDIAEYNGLLYFNGEHTVNTYNPVTNDVQTYCTYNGGQLYGLYIKDSTIYCLVVSDEYPGGEVMSFGSVQQATYTVTWKNDDGTVLKTDTNVATGTMPSYGEDPTKARTQQYTYTFTGWSPEITAVTGDVTYTATYSQTLNQYTVTWKNYDGQTLKTEQIPYDTTPSYDGATPTRPSTLTHSYTFSGWSPTISSVTGDVTYTAQFTENAVETVNVTVYNFINWDNVYIHYWNGNGETTSWPGIKLTATDGEDNFTFTASVPVTATNIIFNDGNQSGGGTHQSPTITENIADGTTWAVRLNKDGTEVKYRVIDSDYYLVGSMNEWTINLGNTAYKFEPNKDSEGGLEEYILSVNLSANDQCKVKSTNAVWFPNGANNNYTVPATALYNIYFRPSGNGDADWHELYFKAKNMTQYTVTFSNDGETSSQTVYYGETVTEPTAPVKEGYTFAGWYNGENAYGFSTPVTANITLTATWYKDITINEIDINGIVTSNIVHKETFTEYTLPNTPYLDGYEFKGWKINGTDHSADAAKTVVESLIESGTDVTIAVVYDKLNIKHTVSCDGVGCTIKNAEGKVITSGTEVNVSEQLYAIADQNSQGQKFSHWVRIQGNKQTIVGYETTYAFRMPDEDMTLSAMYVNNDVTVTKTGTAYIESVKKTGDNEIAFVSVVSVPDGATIKRAGLVISVASLLKDAELTAENSLFESYDSTTCQNYTTFKYTFTVGNVSSHTVCARAYLLYEDETGVQHSVYGDLVTAKISDFNT